MSCLDANQRHRNSAHTRIGPADAGFTNPAGSWHSGCERVVHELPLSLCGSGGMHTISALIGGGCCRCGTLTIALQDAIVPCTAVRASSRVM